MEAHWDLRRTGVYHPAFALFILLKSQAGNYLLYDSFSQLSVILDRFG
jgi:hypothetical protein